jgi:hypothetical protein
MEQLNTDQSNVIKEVSAPVFQARGWMKLIGVLSIIVGVLYALTLIGIIFAWLPIWMGVILYQAGSSSEEAYYNGDKYSFLKSMTQLKLYFTIMGITMLIGIILMVIMMIVFLAGGLVFSEYFDNNYYY